MKKIFLCLPLIFFFGCTVIETWLHSVYQDVPYETEYQRGAVYYYLNPSYFGSHEWVVPGPEYHFERGGGGVFHQGGCYSLRGWEFNNKGYPQLIPPGAKIGNCR